VAERVELTLVSCSACANFIYDRVGSGKGLGECKVMNNYLSEDLVALCKGCHKIADKERITNPTKRYRYDKSNI